MDGKCTFGTRPELDIHMLNEMISREVKHFRNYTTYTPNFGALPVTTKFYAKHDQIKDESEQDRLRIDNYEENVAQTRSEGPHNKYTEPATENMVYGWYPTPIMKMDRNDIRFYCPRKESSNTKIEVIIRMSNPKSQK